jgi:hypothetical protein
MPRPSGIEDIVDMVQGLLAYDAVAQPFHGMEPPPTQADAIHERDAAALLALARALG